jgi:preprotein translocase subunit SecA
MDIMEEVVIEKVRDLTTGSTDPSDWDGRPLADWVALNFPIRTPEEEIMKAAKSGQEMPVADSAFDGLSAAQFAIAQFICKAVRDAYDLKISFEQPEALKTVERYIILKAVDTLWQEHLFGMDSLRDSIGLRAYGQRDPLIEYKSEAFKVFEELMTNIKTEICHNIFRSASSMMAFDKFMRNIPPTTTHQAPGAFGGGPAAPPTAAPPPDGKKASDMVKEASDAMSKAKPIRSGPKVGRNDPCPCKSGKKYKQCCGKNG